ncbi:uncharacterized protein LOC119400047 [Rhipicephalus sanguineus]|uniref:Nlr family card domain protein n=2 Tax=Rhipicephalus sanguineus TaxID=34632 RepID=A0A9D4PIB7_RHISA|nr:uncharacterized protein LOC119400047 [Rhipicephalus sanguineus]KAH7943681.1 hypothetical protein HPB52_009886 [Rhipicephalus sanguineus]
MPKRKREFMLDIWGGPRKKASVLSANLRLAKSFFSGSSINYRTRCTSGEGRLCDIFRDLNLWNEFFWQVGLELRELTPGQLFLVEMHGAYVPLEMPEQKHEAATLLHRLLTLHRCIVSVDLNGYIFKGHHQLICDALRKSPSIRKLKLCLLTMNTYASQSFAAALPHLNHLRELECRQVHFDRTFLDGLSEFLANTESLTTLTMSHLHIEREDAVVILQGLKRNKTITTLSLNTCILSPVSSRCGFMFADYLRENQTLHTLSVTSRYLKNVIELRLIIRALFHNRTLSELNLIRFSLDNENIQLITRLLGQNKTLRRFHMVGCVWYERAPQCCINSKMQHMENFGNVSSRIRPWLVALTENKTLDELTLDMSCFNSDECRSFFKALASNASLKKITVERLRRKDVAEICRALRETGMRERFFLGIHHVIQDPVATLTECKELSRISVDSTILHDFDPLHTTLCLLPSCSHVTSLCLRVSQELFNNRVSSLIAQYITGTTVLRELELTFFFDSGSWNAVDRPERALVQALSVNKGIRRLFIGGLCFDETETGMLADMLQHSRTLCDLSFYPDDYKSAVLLVRKLSPSFSTNYTLLSMRLSKRRELGADWFTVADVVRRNFSLVTRAAHFVAGTRHKYCAAAAEQVHFNPGLVTKVQELASVDEGEAALRIKNSLKSFSELDEFMRMAGVVKESVACHRRDDGQTQLVDLGRDCWLCIRQYLKVGDILDPQ